MQRLSIEVASSLSGWDLYNTLSAFSPEFSPSDDGEGYVVSVLTHDRHVVEVLETLRRFVAMRGGTTSSSIVISLDERRYRLHGETK